MSLLKEIQDEAVRSDSDLGALLRKCKILAARLGSLPLEQWLICESNSYPAGIKLPSYRVWCVELKGHFVDRLTSRVIKYQAIPLSRLPEGIRESASHFWCRQSVASIQQAIKEDTTGSLQFRQDELAIVLRDRVIGGSDCALVLAEFSIGFFIELLNAVRNRILDFALAIEKEEPNAGDVVAIDARITPAKADQIFNMTVYQGGNFVMRDSYQAGQAGAMGPGAHAHDISFQQIWREQQSGIALGELQTELATLGRALSQEASEPEHHVAIGNVMAAEKAAVAGDGPKALGYLKNAGPWALGIATSIGVPVATAALKAAVGI